MNNFVINVDPFVDWERGIRNKGMVVVMCYICTHLTFLQMICLHGDTIKIMKWYVCFRINIISEQEHVNCVRLRRPMILSSRFCLQEELDWTKNEIGWNSFLLQWLCINVLYITIEFLYRSMSHVNSSTWNM